MKEGLWPRHMLSRSLVKPAGGLRAGRELFGSGSAFGWGSSAVTAAVLAACGEVKRTGGNVQSLSADCVFPVDMPEGDAKTMARALRQAGKKCGAEIAHIKGETSACVRVPGIFVTAVGEKVCEMPQPKEGDVIRVLGYTGLMGSLMLAEEGRETLNNRFCKSFIETFADEEELLALEAEEGVSAYYLSGESIFSGLWNFAESAHLGLNVSMQEMPVRQRTVEICEALGVNPYTLRSEGMILTAGGTRGKKIGTFTAPKKRIVMRGEETSYLEKPSGEAFAMWQGGAL